MDSAAGCSADDDGAGAGKTPGGIVVEASFTSIAVALSFRLLASAIKHA